MHGGTQLKRLSKSPELVALESQLVSRTVTQLRDISLQPRRQCCPLISLRMWSRMRTQVTLAKRSLAGNAINSSMALMELSANKLWIRHSVPNFVLPSSRLTT
jgi:hypothetical protein